MPGGGPAVQVPSPPARSLHGPPSHVAPMPKFTDARFQEDFPGAALTPEQYQVRYRDTVEDVAAYFRREPLRVLNPEARATARK